MATEHVSRFYSLALGKEKNFQARTDGLITSGDTTPDVSLHSLLYSDSTNTIAFFDNAVEGQIIHVVNLANERLTFTGAQIKVGNSSSMVENECVTFIHHNSAFYELSRSLKYVRTDGTVAAGDTTPDVSQYKVLYVDTGGNLNITYFDNGEEGQIIRLINLGAGEVQFSGAQMLVADSSDLYANDNISFLFYNSAWYEIGRKHSAAKNFRTAAAGDATPTVQNTNILVFNSAGAISVTDFDDGYEGQLLTVINKGAGGVTLTNDVTKLVIGASGANYLMAASGAVLLTNVMGVWHLASSTNPGALA